MREEATCISSPAGIQFPLKRAGTKAGAQMKVLEKQVQTQKHWVRGEVCFC